MSKKSQARKQKKEAEKAGRVKAVEKKPLTRKQKIIIAVSAALAAVLVAAFIIGLVNVIRQGKELDYMKDDISRYVTISEEFYKSYEIEVELLEFAEDDIDRKINKLLVDNKDKNARFDGASVHKPDYKLAVGDVANIWYSGYFMEDGVRKSYSGMTNYTSSEAHALELGSGTFIKGFEEALIGMNLQTESFSKISSGTVSAGDVAYVSFKTIHADGKTSTSTSERIELGSSKTDEVYGKGFSAFLVGKAIGTAISDKFITKIGDDDADTVYYEMKVDFVTQCEDKAIKINVTFPKDYESENLRGKAVVFDVFVTTAVLYNTPVWNDEFVTSKLKVSADELSQYEGANLAEKYRNKIRQELSDELEEKNNALKEEAMWKFFKEKAVKKSLPDNEVLKVYREYFDDVNRQFELYQSYYTSLDAFAREYFGLESGADWRAYIQSRAEDVIYEKLIFYYILQKDKLVPSDEEFNRLYEENMNEYMDYYKELYKEEIDKCETEEEREAKIAEIKKDMIEYYGEEYFVENTYYQYAVEILVSRAVVK